jgi:uncharacterized protein
MKSLLQHFLTLWKRFIEAHDRPHALAGGVAIGIFIGFTPIFGFKTLLAVGIALLMRCNTIATIVGVSLHDPFVWAWPFLLRLEYQVGYWLLSSPHQFAPKITPTDLKLSEIMHWSYFIDTGRPLLLGSIVIALPLAIVSYIITLRFLYYRQHQRDLP